MIKILSIEKHLERITCCVETEIAYQFLTIDRYDNIEKHGSYNKADYKSFTHFWNIMGKFDPHTLFLKEPILLNQLTYAELVEKA
jgi:hypothetical protein